MNTTVAADRAWVNGAIERIAADFQRSADTHLIALALPRFAAGGIALYLKDESTHPTGSLKHRLARSLFLYALCNGWIGAGSTIVEASSGSTAVSEAYFARLLGLPFIAVMPRGTSPEKVAQIEFHGGRCHWVEGAGQVYDEARALAAQTGGHYMDQFTYAERATDWRGNNNIAESMVQQMAREPHPVPEWIVVGAGTGGTSATIGRYLRYRSLATRLCVADPAGSVFAAYHRSGDTRLTAAGSRIEGIGRPRVEPSFVRSLVDRMIEVPDADSIASMRALSDLLGRRVGPSTGTNFAAVLLLACEMQAAGRRGSILSLLCDSGERYLPTYHDERWVQQTFGDCGEAGRRIAAMLCANHERTLRPPAGRRDAAPSAGAGRGRAGRRCARVGCDGCLRYGRPRRSAANDVSTRLRQPSALSHRMVVRHRPCAQRGRRTRIRVSAHLLSFARGADPGPALTVRRAAAVLRPCGTDRRAREAAAARSARRPRFRSAGVRSGIGFRGRHRRQAARLVADPARAQLSRPTPRRRVRTGPAVR
jgi:cysteine synthase A